MPPQTFHHNNGTPTDQSSRLTMEVDRSASSPPPPSSPPLDQRQDRRPSLLPQPPMRRRSTVRSSLSLDMNDSLSLDMNDTDDERSEGFANDDIDDGLLLPSVPGGNDDDGAATSSAAAAATPALRHADALRADESDDGDHAAVRAFNHEPASFSFEALLARLGHMPAPPAPPP